MAAVTLSDKQLMAMGVATFAFVWWLKGQAKKAVTGLGDDLAQAGNAVADLYDVATREGVQLTEGAEADLAWYVEQGYITTDENGFTQITPAGERYIQQQSGG